MEARFGRGNSAGNEEEDPEHAIIATMAMEGNQEQLGSSQTGEYYLAGVFHGEV